MPKKINYPKASIHKCLDLAQSVDKLGGMSDLETCAEHMGKKLSGGFNALISASTKFGFTTFKSGQLQTTSLYKGYKLAYNDAEKTSALRKAFFNVPVFKDVFEKFKNGTLPIKMLDKILIREFGVDEKVASRVSKYFIEAAKLGSLLKSDFTFFSEISQIQDEGETLDQPDNSASEIYDEEKSESELKFPLDEIEISKFTIKIIGPGINSSIEINEEEDFIILEAMLSKIRKKL